MTCCCFFDHSMSRWYTGMFKRFNGFEVCLSEVWVSVGPGGSRCRRTIERWQPWQPERSTTRSQSSWLHMRGSQVGLQTSDSISIWVSNCTTHKHILNCSLNWWFIMKNMVTFEIRRWVKEKKLVNYVDYDEMIEQLATVRNSILTCQNGTRNTSNWSFVSNQQIWCNKWWNLKYKIKQRKRD